MLHFSRVKRVHATHVSSINHSERLCSRVLNMRSNYVYEVEGCTCRLWLSFVISFILTYLL